MPSSATSRCTGTDQAAVTVALSVALLTVAETFWIAFSLLSPLAAHAARVIPCTRNWPSLYGHAVPWRWRV
jgi:hypothetical protein